MPATYPQFKEKKSIYGVMEGGREGEKGKGQQNKCYKHLRNLDEGYMRISYVILASFLSMKSCQKKQNNPATQDQAIA